MAQVRLLLNELTIESKKLCRNAKKRIKKQIKLLKKIDIGDGNNNEQHIDRQQLVLVVEHRDR